MFFYSVLPVCPAELGVGTDRVTVLGSTIAGAVKAAKAHDKGGVVVDLIGIEDKVPGIKEVRV